MAFSFMRGEGTSGDRLSLFAKRRTAWQSSLADRRAAA
jgi:hypothetical protein